MILVNGTATSLQGREEAWEAYESWALGKTFSQKEWSREAVELPVLDVF